MGERDTERELQLLKKEFIRTRKRVQQLTEMLARAQAYIEGLQESVIHLNNSIRELEDRGCP